MSVNIVDVGTPPDGTVSEDWTTTVVQFHGYSNLPTTRDEAVESPVFSCLGHQWVLALYPGGEAESSVGYAAVALVSRSNKSTEIQFGFAVRGEDCKEVAYKRSRTNEFEAYDSEDGASQYICFEFASRSTMMNSLVNGSLIIEVRMKPTSTDKAVTTQFIPTNPINKNVLQKFMHEESADVVFEVDNGSCENEEERTNKKSKTTTTFYAHRFILQDVSTMLAELCKSDESGVITTVSITDVKPDTFKHMIYYTYGGKLSDEELESDAKDIINACDKYGVVHLKLEAEACYVKSNEISMDNMMDNLLYADSKNLALLKEAVMDYIVKNKHDIIGKVSFDSAPGHLITDVLTATAREERSGGDGEEEDKVKYNKMRVGTLRKMLDEKGLDVDGSREAMIALLKENSA